VVTPDIQRGVLAKQGDDFIGGPAIAHHIAEIPELINTGSRAKHSFEPVNIAVDV